MSDQKEFRGLRVDNGIDKDGKYILCGMPFGYEDYLIMNSFELK